MTIAKSYPFHDMFHTILPPRQVQSQEEHDKLAAEGWTKTYQHQPFPSSRYNVGGEERRVGTTEEAREAAREGFTLTEPPIIKKN